jgi:hypothetical protein
MGESADIDARMQAALARLTENEKECLRRRLQQQMAKEMALELGVSPHGVDGFGTFDTPSVRDGKQVVRSAAEIEDGRRRWIAEVDADDDGRVDQEEYLTWRYPHQARLGVPTNWREWERRSTD